MTSAPPTPPNPAPAPPEVIEVSDHRVKCDGGGGALGHPVVFYEIGDEGFVECGYCDRRFVLQGAH
ncbi:MAG: zinc-finger domain-containing protein [Alphaproteobacteria bacterium]|nr:zinc-finger domain-containing protein [Alphaproteobacteria bacterium]